MRRRTLLAAPLPFAAPALRAQTLGAYPDRPIRLIVPVAVAGAADIVGRILADAMAPLLGRPIVIENVAGAGSTLGAAAFQRAAADGHTLYLATNNHLHMKAAYPQFAFDLVTDFVPLALVSRQPFVLAVNNAVPAHSVAELIGWLRGRAGTAHCGGSFPGSNNAMAAELFKLRAGVDFTIVPYRAAAASVQDLVAGRLDLTIDSATLLLPLLRDGQLRGLAVSTAAASPLLPGLPGMQAAGVADYDVPIWTILFARPGTPPAILATLRAAAARALAEPAVQARLAGAGFEGWPEHGPAAASALLAAEIARWTPITAGMKLGGG